MVESNEGEVYSRIVEVFRDVTTKSAVKKCLREIQAECKKSGYDYFEMIERLFDEYPDFQDILTYFTFDEKRELIKPISNWLSDFVLDYDDSRLKKSPFTILS